MQGLGRVFHTRLLCWVTFAIFTQMCRGFNLPGQNQHFLKAYSLVSSDNPNNKDVQINWQIYRGDYKVRKGLLFG